MLDMQAGIAGTKSTDASAAKEEGKKFKPTTV